MYSGDRPGCPTPESVGVAVVAGAGDVPTRSPTAPVGRARGACGLAGQPRSSRVLPSATGVGPRSARWSRPWHAPGRWPGGTGSTVWLRHLVHGWRVIAICFFIVIGLDDDLHSELHATRSL